jgi:hypothetical protein
MTTSYTSLLGLAQPQTGDLSGTWGDVVNDNITAYLDAAIAGTQIISGSQTAVTLSKTTGANLSQVIAGTTGSSQYQIIRCTGTPSGLLTITAPAADKTYIIINATAQSVKIVGVGPTPTGVTIPTGSNAIVAWNGSDFVNLTPAVSGFLATTGGTMTGNLTLDAYTEKVATLATSGSIALNPSTGTTLSCAAAGTVTFTDSLSSGQSISLLLTNGSSYTINWPAGTTWVTAAGNTAPTLSASNTLVFWKISTTLYGALVGKSA